MAGELARSTTVPDGTYPRRGDLPAGRLGSGRGHGGLSERRREEPASGRRRCVAAGGVRATHRRYDDWNNGTNQEIDLPCRSDAVHDGWGHDQADRRSGPSPGVVSLPCLPNRPDYLVLARFRSCTRQYSGLERPYLMPRDFLFDYRDAPSSCTSSQPCAATKDRHCRSVCGCSGRTASVRSRAALGAPISCQ